MNKNINIPSSKAFFSDIHNKIYILVLLFSLITAPSVSQSRRSNLPQPIKLEDLPRMVLDTIDTPDPETKVIIFSNNTWEFYRPDMSRIADHPTYHYNWDTTSVFSYRNIELRDIPDLTQLNIVDTLSEFASPIQGKVFSRYGPRGRRNHNGVDIPLKIGEPILTAFDGKVRYARYNSGGFGNLVIVRHPNGLETWHAHLSKINVAVNDFVKRGQVLGYGGNTGRSRGPHLHFEVRYKDQSFDPEFLFDFENGELRFQNFTLDKKFFNIRSRASEILEEDDEDSGFDPSDPLLTRDENGNVIKPNDKPKAEASKPQAVYHTIRSGDMLSKLAVRYGVTVDQICRLNNISRTTILQLGRRLRIK